MLPPTYLDGWHKEEDVKKMTYKKLGQTDMVVSSVGIGGAVVGGVYSDKGDLEEIFECVEVALRSGINYIDTAPFYGEGKSEEVLGQALRRVPRHTYYIGTKVGRYGADWKNAFDFGEERILAEIEKSLQRLQLSYVDLIQIHDFEFCQDPERIAKETLPVLEKIVKSGKARYIGINGYSLDEFHKVLDATEVKVDTVLSYARNIFTDMSLMDHVSYFEEKSLGVINASPTGMGLLTNNGPASWHPASKELKALCAEAGAYCASRGVELGNLSVHHNLHNQVLPIAITLLGVGNMKILKLNLDIVKEGLNHSEEEVFKDIIEKFFDNIDTDFGSWENKQIEEYNLAIKHDKC